MDDAGVVALTDDCALLQSVDIFPPVVDDPFWFGRIAAANSLSDIYAMGGRPVSAVNFVAYPLGKLGGEPLRAILQGAFDALKEADCPMAGGHSIQDDEIKFGLAVAGTVHPDRILRNSTAQSGDRLVLTKPLGIGCLTTAIKQGKADAAAIDAGHRMMGRLNRSASELMVEHGAHAATDITGYGLSGHVVEMAQGSGLDVRIDAAARPCLEEAQPYLADDYVCGGSRRNESFAQAHVEIEAGVAERARILLFDVQTSGGLLIAIAADRAETLVRDLRAGGDAYATVVGEVQGPGGRVLVA